MGESWKRAANVGNSGMKVLMAMYANGFAIHAMCKNALALAGDGR